MAKLLLAAVLSDIAVHGVVVGDILEAETAAIKVLVDTGQVDVHKDAVAYRRSQGAAVVRSAIELKAEQEAAEKVSAERATLEAEIAALEGLLAKASNEEAKAAMSRGIDEKRAALKALLG